VLEVDPSATHTHSHTSQHIGLHFAEFFHKISSLLSFVCHIAKM